MPQVGGRGFHYFFLHKIYIITILAIAIVVVILSLYSVEISAQGNEICPSKIQCNPFHDSITMTDAARFALAAGFGIRDAMIIVAIAWAESGGNPFACLYNPPRGGKGCDRGILQINDYWHPEIDDACAFDPSCAFREAKARSIPFDDWVTYRKGTYRDYLSKAHQAVIRVIVEKGLHWLRKHQNPDGSWSNSTGITELATLAFLNYGFDEHDPTDTDKDGTPDVQEAIKYILSHYDEDTGHIGGDTPYNEGEPAYVYDTSLGILVLVAADRTNRPRKYHDIIEKSKDYLLSVQDDEDRNFSPDDPNYGGWGYPRSGWADLSNTQWVIMGLDAAYNYLGLKKPDPYQEGTWTYKALKFLDRRQKEDGGFGYNLQYRDYSYGSMSYAGLWSLLLIGVRRNDSRISKVFNWINNNYSVNENPGVGQDYLYYYYITMAKALTMAGVKIVDSHDWYDELSSKLAELQHKEGYWVNPDTAAWEGNEALVTAYALLALQTQTLPPNKQLSWVLTLYSHADLHLYDEEGRHVGKNYKTGKIEEEIPGATFQVDDKGNQTISLSPPEAGQYRIELVGTSDGDYHLISKGYENGENVSSETYSGTIVKGLTKSSIVTISAMEGALTIFVGELKGTPTGLVAKSRDSAVDLSWRPYFEPDFNLAGYNIYRSLTSKGGYLKVNSSPITETHYHDTKVQNDVTYYYVVTAVDTSENETNYSREASVTPRSIEEIIASRFPNCPANVSEPDRVICLQEIRFATWLYMSNKIVPGSDGRKIDLKMLRKLVAFYITQTPINQPPPKVSGQEISSQMQLLLKGMKGDGELRISKVVAISEAAENGGKIKFEVEGVEIKGIKLDIFDLSGREVFTSGEILGSSFEWTPLDSDGNVLANGVYLYIVTIEGFNGKVIKSRIHKIFTLR